MSPQGAIGTALHRRHARACGHPRLSLQRFNKQNVDGRDKPGHDG
jgi:hypothetical protein